MSTERYITSPIGENLPHIGIVSTEWPATVIHHVGNWAGEAYRGLTLAKRPRFVAAAALLHLPLSLAIDSLPSAEVLDDALRYRKEKISYVRHLYRIGRARYHYSPERRRGRRGDAFCDHKPIRAASTSVRRKPR